MIDYCSFETDDLVKLTGCLPNLAELAFTTVAPPPCSTCLDDKEQNDRLRLLSLSISGQNLRTVGQDDPFVWNTGWSEIADFLDGGEIATNSLKPQYFHKNVECWLFNRLVEPKTPFLKYWVSNNWCVLFSTHLSDVPNVDEYGCGTGINLLLLSKIFPEVKLAGYDWAEPTKRILQQLSWQEQKTIEHEQFNMLRPHEIQQMSNGARGLVTVHALEQLGENWERFLQFVLNSAPALCLHIEPLVELYEDGDDKDSYFKFYHKKRGYLSGFLPRLIELEKLGDIEIVELKRIPFSGLHHEAYSILKWKIVDH